MTKELNQYIEARTGLPEEFASQIILVIREFLLLQLTENKEAKIRFIGRFWVDEKRRSFIRYCPSKSLYRYLEQTKELKSEDYSTIYAQLEDKFGKAHKNAIEALADAALIENESEPVTQFQRYSFLRYLQQQFPFEKDWTHPTTKKVYSNQEIKRAVRIYRILAPKAYLVLWSVWMSISARIELAKLLEIDAVELKQRWGRACDSLLFIIMNPDLEPLFLSETINLKC